MVAEDMKANGGLITREDLAAYQARERRPVLGTYRGFDIISMPPPSSGGVALIEMLNILEPLNLKLTKGLLTVPALHAQAAYMIGKLRVAAPGGPDMAFLVSCLQSPDV